MTEEKRTGYIYQIVNMTNNKKYIGSTFQGIRKRWFGHKKARYCKKQNHKDLYQDMLKLGLESFRCELVKEVQVKNRLELCKIEGEYIRKFDTFNNGYNNKIEGRTTKEYNETVARVNITCQCGAPIRKDVLARHKKTKLHQRLMSGEIKNVSSKEVKPKIATCECGAKLLRKHLVRHRKTKKHQELMINKKSKRIRFILE